MPILRHRILDPMVDFDRVCILTMAVIASRYGLWSPRQGGKFAPGSFVARAPVGTVRNP
jgi:hypothetical protein